MQEITFKIIGDQIRVTSPYNKEFVHRARNLRGKWQNNAWWFDDSLTEYVREIMIEHYGTTGEDHYETCTLLVSDYTDSVLQGPVTLFGRTVAKAFGRDSYAKLGDSIVFISGSYSSGGSVKNWRTIVQNATFEIKDFPIPSLSLSEVSKAIEEGWCTVKPVAKKRPKEEIEAEIKELENRINQLRNEL